MKNALVAALAIACIPFTALAATPSATTSTFPPMIIGCGHTLNDVNGIPYRVVVRDESGTPIVGATVLLDFTDAAEATTGIRTQDPSTRPDCQPPGIHTMTNFEGVATFKPQFLGGSCTPDVAVYADGVLLGHAIPRSSHNVQSAQAMTGEADLALMTAAILHPAGADCRTDLDGNGQRGLGDLVLFVPGYARATPGSYCPFGW